MGIINSILGYLWNALQLSLQQILILIGPGLILALILNYIAGFTEKKAYTLMGIKVYLSLFGWIGTMIHELGHAFFCIIFGHTITDIELFNPDSESGRLGYVNHSFNPESSYQQVGNFFIGIGPILFGSVVIYLCSKWLIGDNLLSSINSIPTINHDTGFWNNVSEFSKYILSSAQTLLSHLSSSGALSNWKTYLFLYLVFSIGSSITLSPPDIEGALSGLGYIIGMLLFVNILTMWIFPNLLSNIFSYIAQYYTVFYMVMVLAILMNLIAATIFLAIPATSKTALEKIAQVSSKRKL